MRSEKAYPKDGSRSGISSQPNRLIYEKSPYLLQHAYNPVDWHPWSEEAFDLAKREDKPVFLSIGYSTCHWCHVMAQESFEDLAVAKLLNDAFICIKVDREERPDIDQIYMAACQAMTGRGGWPLTIIMTSDKKPFFAATYIPKGSRFGSTGMLELIPKIKDMWINSREELLESSENIMAHLVEASSSEHGTTVDQTVLERAYQGLVDIFDPQNGGFGSAPKFPTPHNLFFLLRYWSRTRDPYALEMVEVTLEAMRMGGICDQLGFGFHRYSTDASWLVPHFEKMLYDQALLALAYTEAYQATRKELYSRAAQEILTYVLRDMTSPEGGFYSAEDADSEGEEGRFYLWTADELRALLDREQYTILSKVFDIREEGNFKKGMNVLAMRSSLQDAASVIGISQRDLEERLNSIREKLFWAREKRIHPNKDDKILADWNGLVIAALARASQILQRPDYAKAARFGADFILEVMRRPDGRLYHRYRDGSGISAILDDYSFLAWGLIELYEAVFETRYLQAAIDLSNAMIEHFWDNESGGFFFAPDDAEVLPIRQKLIYDGALPSGNSVAMLNLLRLSHLTGNYRWHELANKINLAFSGIVAKHPAAYCMFLTSSVLALGPVYQVAIVGDPNAQDTSAMLQTLRSRFLPNKAVLLIPMGQQSPPITKVAEYAKNFSAIDGKATAYVCANNACRLPTCSSAAMLELLGISH